MEYVQKTTPYKHQQMILEERWSKEWWGFLLDMGTGKSKIIIDNIFALREAGLIDRAMIVAPKGNYDTWTNEQIPTHAPDHHLAATHVHLWTGGGTVRERDSIKKLLGPSNKFRILVVNIEALSSSMTAQRLVDQFLSEGSALIAVDESSTIKNPGAERTKKLLKWGRKAKYRRIATGTPMTRSPMDLWSQFEFLSPGCLGQRSFYGFRARYAILKKQQVHTSKVVIVNGKPQVVRGHREYEAEVGYRGLDELRDRVQQHATILKKEDCLDLPPKIPMSRIVELTKEQKRHYDDLVNDAISLLDGGEMVTYQHKIVLIMRLQQIVAGHIVDDSGNMTLLPQNRTKALEEILEESSGKTIIWCNFRPDVALVAEKLREMGRTFVIYGEGDVDRSEAIRSFQNDDNPEIFLSTVHRGGYGITLTRAQNVIYFSHNYDLEKRLQTEDRAHRIGQTKSVVYTDIRTVGTIEDRIVASLQKKQSMAKQVTDNSAFAALLRGIDAPAPELTEDQRIAIKSTVLDFGRDEYRVDSPPVAADLFADNTVEDNDPPPSFMLGE